MPPFHAAVRPDATRALAQHLGEQVHRTPGRRACVQRCIAALSMGLALAGAGPAGAQVAGAMRPGSAAADPEQVVPGWSAKQSILGRPVYNASGARLGRALDLIVGTDKRLTYLILDTGGGAIGVSQRLVAVPAAQLRVRGARLLLPEADRQALAAAPAFVHAPVTRTQSAIVERAQQDVDKSRQAIAMAERRSAQSSGEARARADRQIAALRQSQQAVEDKVDEMDIAGPSQWQAVEAEIGRASARLRSAMRRAPD
jgi:hypothetical protein